MPKPLVVVTGKNGQLGWELEQLSVKYQALFDFLFLDKHQMDLAAPACIPLFFEKQKPAYFINCAAYTAVDKAEAEQEQAYIVNAESVGVIARQCNKYNCTLITVSTDYVFNGKGDEPYNTDAVTNPVNYYGYTKWAGEKLALENNERTIIIRTSWVYSTHGNNFVKTMLRLMKERPMLKVVSDQIGSPTYAADLAECMLKIINALHNGNTHYGIYHYSNTGAISWFDFATSIRDLSGLHCDILPISTAEYPTPAKRPSYSVMNTQKISTDFEVPMKDWEKSLQECIDQLISSR